MKSILMNAGAVILVAMLAQSNVLAQGPGRGRLSPEERTAELKKVLKLTDEQAGKVKAIYEQQDKELRAMFESGDGNREAMRKKVKEADEKILALLNKEQQTKYKQWVEERRSRFEQRRLRRD